LSATINYVRLSLLRRNVEVERSELGGSGVIVALQTNHLPGNSELIVIPSFDVNTDDFDTARVEFGFTDGRGNVLQPAIPKLELERHTFCIVF
jgi:hypothetical protein